MHRGTMPALLNGLGAAIVPLCIGQSALASGALVRPFSEAVPGRYGYYLMQSRPLQGGPYLEAFTGWVQELAGSLNAL
jgi:LysR family glycine cleavage system transcriptional activator